MGNVVINILNDDFRYFALLTTLEASSPIDILKNTEEDFKCLGNKILVDNILNSGNNSDRFLEFKCEKGKIDYFSANYVQIDRKDVIRITANDTLRKYPAIINNSILNSAQKKLLLNGVSI